MRAALGLTLGAGFLAILCLPLPLSASELWRIDSTASRVDFALRLLMVRRLEGRFPYVEGEVRIEDGAAIIDVQVDAEAVMMDKPAHAEWARSPEFFDTARHPWIQFRSRALTLERFRRGGVLEGDLTLRGATRPIALTLDAPRCGADGQRCRVTAKGKVPRNEFGMTSKRMVLANDVELAFDITVENIKPLPHGTVEVGPLHSEDQTRDPINQEPPS